jgi:glycosyltransferase involved in cell wall biosynthesis
VTGLRVLVTADAVGGVWQYSTELAAALAPLGVEAVIALMGPSPSPFAGCAGSSLSSLSLGEREGGAKRRTGEGDAHELVHVIPTNLPLDWLAPDAAAVHAAGDAIAALARDVGADVIHLNSPALAAKTRFSVPVVAVGHGCVGTWWRAANGSAPDPDHAWHTDLMARGLRAADAIVAPSAAFAAALQQVYALPDTPTVVHNGRTPLPMIEAEAADHVFTAGRLWDAVKNTPLLDRIAARLPVPLRAAGSTQGPHGERVDTAHLHLLGSLNIQGMARELAGRPVFVSAAGFEPFGLAVLEAAAAGCPLVLSGIDTFRELWTGAALFVESEDEDGYLSAIARVRSDAALRAHLGEAARLRSARYTPQAMAGQMAAIYAQVTATPRRAAA